MNEPPDQTAEFRAANLLSFCGMIVPKYCFTSSSCSRRPESMSRKRTFFFSSRRRHTRSVSAFLLNRSSDLLSKQQQVSEIMRQMLTQAQTAGQYFTNDQIKEMTRKVSAEVDLVHQQTQNQRYGSSHIGATAKDISNVVTDA